MKYLKVFAALGVLALASAGSASLLDVYGTISGTADVQPALEIGQIGSSTIEVEKNMKDEFTSDANLTANGTTAEFSVITSDSKNIEFSEDRLSGSYDVTLEIDGNQVDSKEVGN